MKKRSKGDKAAARELILFADNESSIYPQRVSIHKNLLKKIKAGKYSDTKAAKLWGYWFEAAAKSYARQMANPADWSRIFSASTRRLAARTYASREGRILRAAARGETQDYIYKNPRKKYSNSVAHRKEFKRLAREAIRDARRWAKDHGKDEKYRAIIRRAREWSRESFARKNPSGGVYLAAKRGTSTFYFKGGKFSSGKSGAKVFATGARAMEKATQLAKRFSVLNDYVLYPERVPLPK